MVNDLLILLDFLSRAVAVLLTISAVLGFAFRKFVNAWIDARFKRQVDTELETLRSQLAGNLEEKKSSLAREMNQEIETLKSEFALEIERKKHALDEHWRRDARIYDKNLAFYETYYFEYGQILNELWALQHDFTAPYNKINPELGAQVRSQYVLKTHVQLGEANRKIEPLGAHVDVFLRKRIAQLFSDLSNFLSSDATDKERLGALTLEYGLINATLRSELTGRP
jgi:Skp family chaperone for outer membrane proteins